MHIAAFILTVLIGASSGDPAQENAPRQIESWPQTKVIAMGREIYRQDRAAWLATDAIMAANQQRPPADIRGWIVVPDGERDRVRFLAADETGVHARWDVTVGPDGAGSVEAASSPDLTPDELARWMARQTAIANRADLQCGPSMNSVVTRDPDSDGWLVWLLTATTEHGVIPIGGHQRFTISADGRTVLLRESLSMGCLNMRTPETGEVGDPSMVYVTHVVSDGPVETHVFLSFLNQMPIAVGVEDRVFVVIGDRIDEYPMPDQP